MYPINRPSEQVIRELAAKGILVEDMSKQLGIDIDDLSSYYCELSLSDRRAYPIELLITREWLEHELQSKPFSRISYETQTAPSIIKRLAAKYGIKLKPRLKSILNRDVLFNLFVNCGMTDSSIANQYHCSIDTIKWLRKQYNITSKTRIDPWTKLPIELFHRLHVAMGLTLEQISRISGINMHTLKKMNSDYSKSDHPLAIDIGKYKKSYAYQVLISELINAVEPTVLFEQLKEHSLAEVAEMYEVIPPADPGVETFSPEWLKKKLKWNTLREISSQYHISLTYLQNMVKDYNINDEQTFIEEPILRLLYLDNHWTDVEISKTFGITLYTLRSLRNKSGISSKKKKPLHDRLTLEEFKRLYIELGLTAAQIAYVYNTAQMEIYNLKKKYSKIDSMINNHRSTGVNDEKLKELRKAVKYKNMPRI